jgi:hypothetical protein
MAKPFAVATAQEIRSGRSLILSPSIGLGSGPQWKKPCRKTWPASRVRSQTVGQSPPIGWLTPKESKRFQRRSIRGHQGHGVPLRRPRGRECGKRQGEPALLRCRSVPPSGRDHRSRVQLRHRRRSDRGHPAHSRHSRPDLQGQPVPNGARVHFPDRLADPLNYRGVPLSVGSAGHIHGGDRLPWALINGKDNFASLGAMTWQIHVYGTARAEVAAWFAGHDVPLHIYDWRSEHGAAGLARDALYLLRPDIYLALADTSGETGAIDRYCAEHEIQLGVSLSRAR